jgi:DNA-binding winged helix-turn-helix (wHTH) protein
MLGEILVEPDVNTISRGDTTVRVELKAMALLALLASRAERLVTRWELLDAVWGTEFICDNTLSQAICDLRRALCDDARDPKYIETIHRRGYRLLVPARIVESPEPGPCHICRMPGPGVSAGFRPARLKVPGLTLNRARVRFIVRPFRRADRAAS